MLFQSREFIFLFLPIVLSVFIFLRNKGQLQLLLTWTLAASLFYYAYWYPPFLLLFSISIVGNFFIGKILSKNRSKTILALGICANFSALFYYKYTGFIVSVFQEIFPNLYAPEIILPIGISFFTFQQIAYLVDVYQGKVYDAHFVTYALFVSFFPHLIAGPLVHHQEMMPQFENALKKRKLSEDLAVGFTIFAIGVFKKTFIADSIGRYVDEFFGHIALYPQYQPDSLESWAAAITFGLQIYFDFSGYSDMAVGLSRLFGVVLPVNFWSPYRSPNIIAFWRRWHITLSRVLRDYLYLPLGGNRNGVFLRYLNLMIVMLIGGLWHGASWKFLLWGGMHGLFLIINHFWNWLKIKLKFQFESQILLIIGTVLTYLAVNIAWVPFRASSLETTMRIYNGMFGFFTKLEPSNVYYYSNYQLAWIVILLSWVFFLPNTQIWMSRYGPVLDIYRQFKPGQEQEEKWWKWEPNIKWAIYVGLLFFIGLCSIRDSEAFIYFQF